MAHIHVESMQTAVPTRVALDLGRTLPIAVTGPPIAAVELQHRFRAVLYYRSRLEGEAMAQLEQAAWVQEALSATQADHPKMAGRLWRRHAGGGEGPWDWDVKLCDAGVRLLMASVDTTLTAFLEMEDVSHNGLTGEVPEALAAAGSLYVNNNKISGEVPEAVARSVFDGRMTTFYAQHNFLTGFPVPPTLLPESRPADQCRSSGGDD